MGLFLNAKSGSIAEPRVPVRIHARAQVHLPLIDDIERRDRIAALVDRVALDIALLLASIGNKAQLRQV